MTQHLQFVCILQLELTYGPIWGRRTPLQPLAGILVSINGLKIGLQYRQNTFIENQIHPSHF